MQRHQIFLNLLLHYQYPKSPWPLDYLDYLSLKVKVLVIQLCLTLQPQGL